MDRLPARFTPERAGIADRLHDIIRPHKPLVVPNRD